MHNWRRYPSSNWYEIDQKRGSKFGAILRRHLTLQRTRSSADADNRLAAFSGQSRSTNMVPFHMLHIVSYCAIVTLSLRQSYSFYDIRVQKIS